MEIRNITRNDVLGMNYNELIGLVKETNRAPGGNRAIIKAIQDGFIDSSKKVLDIGTSTGVTSIELARMSGCHVTGIDINELSLEEARERSRKYSVENRTEFKKDDATNLSFADETFDIVFCGNVTSLVSDRKKAFSEYARVLKKGGLLIAIPMYYTKTPPEHMVEQVREAIQVQFDVQFQDDWINFFNSECFETFLMDHFQFDDIEMNTVSKFIDTIINRPHLQKLDCDALEALQKKYSDMMMLFRDNLAHMGFSIIFLRKESTPMDSELFTSRLVKN